MVVKKNYVARKRDWCSKMTQVTNIKVIGESKTERKKKERKKKIGRMRNNPRCLTAVRAIGASIQKKGI